MNTQKLDKSSIIMGIFTLSIGWALCLAGPGQGERILSVNIGPAEYQLGVDFMAGPPAGPCDFTIDNEGNILVVDIINKKIKKFDNNGDLKLSFVYTKLGGYTSIGLGKDSCIYMFVEDPLPWVKKFDKEGQLLINRRVHASEGDLSIDSEGSIYVNHPRFEMVKLDDELNQIFRKPERGEGIPVWHIVNGRAFKLREIKEDGEYKIGVKQVEDFRAKKGKVGPLLEKGSIIPVSTAEKEYLLSPRPIGEDDEGNLYIVYTVGRRRAYHRRVLKLNPDGEKIGEIDIYTEWRRASVRNPFEVDNRGNVYVMTCGEEKVWIDKYPTEMFK